MNEARGQRRVVTGEVDGRSVVESDGEAARLDVIEDLWIDDVWITAADGVGHGPAPDAFVLEPPPGSVQWRVFSIPPDEHLYGGADAQADARELGWHRTSTVDLVYVLDGDITLELEEAVVDLHAGNCVVQRGTNHAWRNRGSSAVRLLTVMIGTLAVDR